MITTQRDLLATLGGARWKRVIGMAGMRGQYHFHIFDGDQVSYRVATRLWEKDVLIVKEEGKRLSDRILGLACIGTPDEEEHMSTPWCYRGDDGTFVSHHGGR